MIRITMQNGKTIDIELDHSAAPILKLHHRMNDRLWMNYHFNLLRTHSE